MYSIKKEEGVSLRCWSSAALDWTTESGCPNVIVVDAQGGNFRRMIRRMSVLTKGAEKS
jgi:hypothetical protein